MKKTLLAILLAMVFATLPAQAKNDLTPEQLNYINDAIDMFDSGKRLQALEQMEALCKKLPKNYVANYETLLMLYQMGEYDEVVARGKKWLKASDNSPLIFQLYGNALSSSGKPNEAIEIYKQGMKKYPSAGMLYLEGGNVYMMHGYDEEALRWYNNGILNDPEFPSCYYRAADLYFKSPCPAWGLVYAEAEMLLNPGGSERFADMARSIADCYRERIVLGGDSVWRAKLAESREILMSPDEKGDSETMLGGRAGLKFPGVFEGCTDLGLLQMSLPDSSVSVQVSVAFLTELRRNTLKNYYEVCHNLYGDGMYLLVFQKKVLDAGHWDAYNYFLFRDVFQAECDDWVSENEAAMDSFIEWYNDGNHFGLDKNRSVGELSVLSQMKPLSLADALTMQAALMGATVED